jgi:hypothetical protein
MRVWLGRESFAPSRLFSVAAMAIAAGVTSAAHGQTQAIQPYLLTVDACPPSVCSQGPTGQNTYLLQSADGQSWSPVPGFTPFQGGVAGVVRRGNTIYIVTQAPPLSSPQPNQFSQMHTVRYHLDTGVQDPPVQFVVQDAT